MYVRNKVLRVIIIVLIIISAFACSMFRKKIYPRLNSKLKRIMQIIVIVVISITTILTIYTVFFK